MEPDHDEDKEDEKEPILQPSAQKLQSRDSHNANNGDLKVEHDDETKADPDSDPGPPRTGRTKA